MGQPTGCGVARDGLDTLYELHAASFVASAWRAEQKAAPRGGFDQALKAGYLAEHGRIEKDKSLAFSLVGNLNRSLPLQLPHGGFEAVLVSDRVVLAHFVPSRPAQALGPVATMKIHADLSHVSLNLGDLIPFAKQALELEQVPLDDIQRALESLLTDQSFQTIEMVEDRGEASRDLQRLGCEVLDAGKPAAWSELSFDVILHVDPELLCFGTEFQQRARLAVSRALIRLFQQLADPPMECWQVHPYMISKCHTAESDRRSGPCD